MAKDPREYGFEGEMAMSQLKGIMQHAKQLHGMLKPDTDLPEWVQSKITLAYDYMQTAADYMSTEMNEDVDAYADALIKRNKQNLNKGHVVNAARIAGMDDKKLMAAVNKKVGRIKEEKLPFEGPYRKVGPRKDEFGNVIKNVPKHLAKKAIKGLTKEEAPANAVGGGKIAGMGVGPQGEPGVGPKAMKRYKDKNAAAAPKAGRKAFSIFMQGK